jgi:diguanylate cyclase (GGDEF)-like protein
MSTPDGGEADLHPQETSSALAAIERERFRSYSALVRNLHWLAAAVVVLYTALVPGENRLELRSLAAAMVLYTLVLHSHLLGRLSLETRMGIETVLDLAWTTAVVLFSGTTASPLFFLYYLVLNASSPSTSRRQIYLKAALATVLAFGMALWVGPMVAGLVWPLMGLWLVAYFSAESGSLGASLQRSLFLAAHTDALTELPNLRSFTALSDLRDKLEKPYTVVMVDADGLKQVNDTHGHANGNELIRTIAQALRSGARGDDLCSRIGGDEFIVRLEGASGEGALAYCRRVRAYLDSHPLRIDGVIVPISVSMGIASFPEHGRSLSEVTEHADQALYQSKREGRSRERVWAA